MRNSTILFLVALLILGWFGAEAYTAQNICVTGCFDLSVFPGWQQAIIVVIFPALLVVAGLRARSNERKMPHPQLDSTP
ncbi:MAG: hypothetical protein JRN67_12565 [Nitrososphaerota archaeon]|nr:hypothetical protein [Nitrososphaerota archaeon]MDG7000797.1 hypothetical protein [Nitrososphaerota archaeon]